MNDRYGYPYEDGPDRSRPRPAARPAGRKKKKKKRKRRGAGRTILAVLLTLLLLGCLGGGGWFVVDRMGVFASTPDYPGAGSGEVTVQVKPGDSAGAIGATLVAAGVVKSSAAFTEAAMTNSLSKNIQPGQYRLRKQMKAALALTALLDPKNRVVTKVTIPEGRTAKSIFRILSEQTKIPVAQFEAAAKNPVALGVPESWFKRSDGKKVTRSIEGFLFPSTYEIEPNPTAAGLLKMLVKQFLAVAEELDFTEKAQRSHDVSAYEALIVASLAQAEAGIAKDLGKVARVAYNRVNNDSTSHRLQFDSAINYYWELTGKAGKSSKELKQSELDDRSNPYNTHIYPGLTPTPIGNPGKAALDGAVNTPSGKWIFFVAIDKEGNSAFATTDAEHERNKAIARRNGVL